MQLQNPVDFGPRLLCAAEMPESRSGTPKGNPCLRRDRHCAPSPVQALFEATREKVSHRADCEGEGGRYVVERIHAQRYRDLGDRIVALAAVGVDGAGPVAHKGRVGMHRDRPFGKLLSLFEAAGENGESVCGGRNAGAVVRSRRKGAGRSLAGVVDLVPSARMPAVRYTAGDDVGEGAEGLRVVRVELYGSAQEVLGASEPFSTLRVIVGQCTQIAV